MRFDFRPHGLALLLTAVLASCTSAPPGDKGAPQPELVIKWFPSCSDRSGQDLFAVSAFANGDVVFVGGPRSREVGERREQLAPGTAARMLKLADSVRQAPVGARKGPRLEPDDPEVPLCIEIQRRTFAGIGKVWAESSSSAGVAFTDAMVTALPLQRWVCPGREVDTTSKANPGALCQRWYLLDVVRATFHDPPGCHSYHSVRVYEDGTVHYSLTEVFVGPGPYRNRIASEKYYTIDRASVDRLVHVVASFTLEEDHTQMICWNDRGQSYGCPPSTVAPHTDNPDDVERFRQALDETVGIEWGALVEKPKFACSSRPDSRGSVWLAYELRDLARNRR